jgi:hypothetical protein
MMSEVFKLEPRVMVDVERNVQSRITNQRYHLGESELDVIGALPVELFYQKVLAYRRKRFNHKSSPSNLYLLRQAIYACHYISTGFDDMRVSEYKERKENSNA